MRILVYDMPNTLNYGSMMMAENFLNNLRLMLGDKSQLEAIIITNKCQETKQRFESALNNNGINIITISPNNIHGGKKIDKIFNLITGKNIKNIIIDSQIDAAVVFGGDDFSEDYGFIGPLMELIEFYHLKNLGIKVFMCGQTIGPFYKWRKYIFKKLLRNIEVISARDPITYEYLTKDFRLKNVTLNADLAFLPLARENDNLSINIPPNYITIVPSGLIWRYAKIKNRESYIEFLVKLVVTLYKEYKIDIVLLPHVVTDDDICNDVLTARDVYIYSLRAGIPAEKIHIIKSHLLPFEARKILGRSKFVMTGRMHAAISSFEQGVPAISYAYSRKYHGIIGEYFGMESLIIDVRDITWDEALKASVNALRYVEENEKILRDRINVVMNDMQVKALAIAKDFVYRVYNEPIN